MGHIRLGTLPDTRPWNRVVRLIADGESVASVAGATTTAAIAGLDRVKSDPGLGHVIYLLAHTVLAARTTDFSGELSRLGISIPSEPGLFDLTAGFAAAADSYSFAKSGKRSDLGEMASLAAVEAITH